jgi:hypothetical protein
LCAVAITAKYRVAQIFGELVSFRVPGGGMSANVDSSWVEAVMEGGVELSRFLRIDDDTVTASVVYVAATTAEGTVLHGAYYGYCGGGENEGGFFMVDIEANEDQNYTFDDIDNMRESDELLASLYDFLISSVWEPIHDNDGEGPLGLNDLGVSLLAESPDKSVYLGGGFDGDLLEGVSELWSISLRFEG